MDTILDTISRVAMSRRIAIDLCTGKAIMLRSSVLSRRKLKWLALPTSWFVVAL